jgi:hypothetical protein
MSGNEESRAGKNTLLYRLFEGELSAAAVADGCEPAMQHLRCDIWLTQKRYVVEVAKCSGEAGEAWDCHEVDVRIEEARADVVACAVDGDVGFW